MFFNILSFTLCVAVIQAQFPPVYITFDRWGRPDRSSWTNYGGPDNGQFPSPPKGQPTNPLPVPSTSNRKFDSPANISLWEIGQNYAGQQSKEGMGVNSPMDRVDGHPCRPDMNSPILPDCLQKYIKNGVLVDGNSNKCGNKAVLPAKLDVNNLLNKAEQLVKSAQCQGELKGGPLLGPPKCEGLGVGNCDTNTSRLQAIYAEKDMGDSILIVTNGVPDHCYDEGADRQNPNPVCEQYRAVLIPKKPRKTNTFREYPMGIVGVAKSGGFFFNHKSAERTCNLAAITEKPTFDTCDGHASPLCQYHYHKAPICIPGFDKCGLMGYNSDGFGVYGKCNFTINGQQVVMKSCYKKMNGKNGCDASHFIYDKTTEGCNLDEANGYSFQTNVQSNGTVFEAGSYAYFFTPEYPFIMPGYYGDKSLVKWCVVNI